MKKLKIPCALMATIWFATNVDAAEYLWVGGDVTAPDSWEKSSNWDHVDNILDKVIDDGHIPDQNTDHTRIEGQSVYWPHAYQTRNIGKLDIKNGAKVYTGPFDVPSPDNSSILVSGPTEIKGIHSSLNVRSKSSLFPHVEFRTDDLLVSLGGDLDMSGGVAEVRGELVTGLTGDIRGFGTIRMADADQDSINNNGLIVAQGGTLRITRPNDSNAFLNLDGGNGTGKLAAANNSTLWIDPFGSNPMEFGSTISIYEGGVVDVKPQWNLGSSLNPATLYLMGGADVATLRGGDVSSVSEITVQNGRGRIESNLDLQLGTISTEPNTILELAGDIVIHPAANASFKDQSQIVVSGNTRVESSAFDWDGPNETAITHVKPGGLFSFIGTSLDGVALQQRYSGELIIDGNAIAHVDPTLPSGFDDTWTADGSIHLNDVQYGTSAKLKGSRLKLMGNLTGNGTVENDFTNHSGTVDPGGSLSGHMLFTKDFETDGILNFDIQGSASSPEHDQVFVNGSASLGGFATATLDPNYALPTQGYQQLTVLTANGGIGGQFLNNHVSFGDGKYAGIHYTANDVLFHMFQALPGDANGDRIFNSSDLVQVFRYGQYEDGIADNSIWESGDWNGDQDFDTSDLVLAFQQGNYSEGLAVAVPEPASAAMVFLCGLGCCVFLRSRKAC